MPTGNFQNSIHYRFLKYISIILLVSTCALSSIIALNEWFTLRNALITKGRSFASYIANLSIDPLIMKDSIQLDNIVKEINKDEDILYCLIEDAHGNFMTSQYASLNYKSPRLKNIRFGSQKGTELPDMIRVIKRETNMTELSLPIRTGTDAIGKVLISLSEDNISKQIMQTIIIVIVLNMLAHF